MGIIALACLFGGLAGLGLILMIVSEISEKYM